MILFLLVAGPGFLALGLWNLRARVWQEGVPVLELLIDRALGEEPPPRTPWDRRLARFHGWMMILFGSLFSLALAAVVFSQFVTE
ncbi:MAG: hypothetical protein WDN44_00735 [Sphingomonas sp.]